MGGGCPVNWERLPLPDLPGARQDEGDGGTRSLASSAGRYGGLNIRNRVATASSILERFVPVSSEGVPNARSRSSRAVFIVWRVSRERLIFPVAESGFGSTNA